MESYTLDFLMVVMGVPLVAISLLVVASVSRQITLAGGQTSNVFSDIASKFKEKK